MAKLIAIEWDRKELRLLAGSRRGTQIVVENAVAIAMPSSGEGEAAVDMNATAAIGQALNKLRLAKGEAVVSVGRANVELRTLQLPKVESDDLPDIVRFQAMKQFAGLTEASPVDFVVLPSSAGSDDTLSVLAASLNLVSQKEIQKQAADAGLEIQKIILRPFAVAQLLPLADEKLRNQNLLMVDILGDEADLTIVEKGCVVFIRSVKLPSSDESVVGPWLVGEMRRTLMAAAGQRNGLNVDQVLVWAQQSVADSLSDRAASQLQLPIEVIDPFSKVKVEDEAKKQLQEIGKSRFAPLLGVLVAEAAGHKHDIDFLNTKRRPPKKKPVVRYALMAGAAASLVLGGLWYYYSSHSALDSQIAELTLASKDLDEAVELAQKNTQRWKAVEAFVEKEVVWLDELERLSSVLPGANEVIVRNTNFSLIERGAGLAKLEANAVARDRNTGSKIEDLLRNPPYYQVEPKPATRISQKIEGLEDYSWLMDGDIIMMSKPPKGNAPAVTNSPAKSIPAAETVKESVPPVEPPKVEPPNVETQEQPTAEAPPVPLAPETAPADKKPTEPEQGKSDAVLTEKAPLENNANSDDVAGK